MTAVEPSIDLIPEFEQASQVPDFDSHFFPHELVPGQPEIIDTSVSLYDPHDIVDFLGFEASIPAVIDAGDKQLMVVDLRFQTDISGARRFIKRTDGTVEAIKA